MINVCLFGAGRIGAVHAANIARHSEVNICYVVDAYEPAAQKLATLYGATVVSAEHALADPKVDGVIIASSTNTHANLMELAARAKKAIFCEKPVDLSVKRVRECLAIVKEMGVVCSIGFNRRYDPQFSALKQAIVAGEIGNLEMLTITSRDPSPPPIEYIEVSGGLFRDMMIHDFDMARWLLDEEVVEVFATASCQVDAAIGSAGDVDTALVTLKTASGKLCQISNSRRASYGYDQRVEAFGSKGMAQVANQTESTLTLTNGLGRMSAKPEYFFLERYNNAYRLELDNFVACIRNEAVPVAGPMEGLQSLILAEAAVESLRTAKAISL
ncbi:MAG: inositol 2-dehydrogenase [Oceanospirillaceae bacterium]|nr:inositol 2-dehydrogenase [Oceanospirillaceae bacterium]